MRKAIRILESIKMSKPTSPYYAVIFTSILSDQQQGYAEMAKKMEELAQNQAGFLGMDSARDPLGITVSYWESLEAIDAWRKNSNHRVAKALGKKKWYSSYDLKICKVIDVL